MKLEYLSIFTGLVLSTASYAGDVELTSFYNRTHTNIRISYVVCTKNVCNKPGVAFEYDGLPDFTIWLKPDQIVQVHDVVEWEYERNKPYPDSAKGSFDQCIGHPGRTINLEIDKASPKVIRCEEW